jgi:cyclin-dependent kinase 12/13
MENEREGFPLTALREIKILRQLHHPAIVNLMGIVVDVKRNKELLTKSPASFYLV